MSKEEQQLARGDKWSKKIALAEYELTLKDEEDKETDVAKAARKTIEWLNSQKSIVDDIQEYKDYEKLKAKAKKAGFKSVEEYQADLEKKRLAAEAKAKKEAEAKANKEQ